MSIGHFTISLDFELHWGNFDKWVAKDYHQYFINTREIVIPGMLQLFEAYGVHCTWATVGALMHHNKKEFEQNLPKVWPNYVNSHLGMRQYLSQIGVGEYEEKDPYHFAPSLVKKIVATPGQELATHTFAHYFCNEAGQTINAFTADLNAAISVQQKNWNSTPVSIVFPRNQFGLEHIRACKAAGITNIRSNPKVWWWKVSTQAEETRILRLMRGGDAYFKLGGPFSYPIKNIKKIEGVWALPASRLLRAYHPKVKQLEKRRMQRILDEMTYAAKHGEVYHLWWHPHNFGWYPHENLKALEKLLAHFMHLKNTYGMTSLTMNETVNELEKISKR